MLGSLVSLAAFIALAQAKATHFSSARDVVSSVVDLGYSQYRGYLNEDTQVTNFLGVRFAAPPTGNSRFRPPQAPAPTSGVIEATSQPPQCYQSPFGLNPGNPFRDGQSPLGGPVSPSASPEDEDCLFLNVHVPGSVDASKSLPVVVWIHGGGYVQGSASVWDATDFVIESGNAVIAVVIQYRLGLFGFLAGSAVKADGAPNAGLLDQEFALEWIQQHIQQFGGDPGRVTIWGVSSGGGSVIQHLVARDGTTGTRLFKNAISSSTFVPSQYAYNDPISETLFYEAAVRTSCQSSSSSATLACLRGASAASLQLANQAINVGGFYGTFVFVPVIDGTFIVRPPAESFQQGKVNGLRLLSLLNVYEGRMFVNPATAAALTIPQYASLLFPKLTPAEAQAVEPHYSSIPGLNFDKFGAIYSDVIFNCPTLWSLRGFDGIARKGTFAVPPADHGYDVSYYFPSGAVFPRTTNSASFVASFVQPFLSFVRFDDPNQKFTPTFNGAPNVTPNWLVWTESDSSRVDMIFTVDSNDQPAIQASSTSPDLVTRCTFWESIADQTGH